MRIDYEIGDVVVFVGGTYNCLCCGAPCPLVPLNLYTVVNFVEVHDLTTGIKFPNCLGVQLKEVTAPEPHDSFEARDFRKAYTPSIDVELEVIVEITDKEKIVV